MKHYFITFSLVTILVYSFLFIGCTKSYATREISMDASELAKTSTDVVVAKCVSSEAKKDENTGFIYTYTTFKVDESLKGKYDDEVVLRIIGGTVGDTTIKAPDVPTFSPDEEVVLFLGPKNTMGYPVLKSINRGVYRIQSDESGAKVITTPVVGLDIIDSKTNERVKDNSKIFLDDFINSVSQSM